MAVDIDPAARKTAERMVKCAGYKRFVDFCAAKPATVLDHVGAVAGAAVVADTTETPLSLMHDAVTLVGELRRAPELAAAPVAALTRDGLLARALHAEPERSIAVMPNNEEAALDVWPSLDHAAAAFEAATSADAEKQTADAADEAASTPMPEPAATLDLGDGKKTYYRDTNTMPNWAGSCWYYMRYLDPTDTKHMVEKDEFDYWMGPDHNKTAGKSGGVDLYIGGVEHAVLHLLYSRFWHKVLFDLGYVDSMEPFHKLFNQGMIQAYAYTDDRGQYVPAAEVVEGPADANGEPTFTWNGQHANREFGKMGKSLKNIITPDDMYENYGADTFRLYEMGMGPLAESRPWNTRNVVGSMRFLQRLWRNVIDETTGEVRVTDGELDTKTLKLLNNTIADVTVEMEAMRPNTAIAKLIVLNNHLTSLDAVPRAAVEPLILMLSPIAPHICEELWSKLGHTESLAHADWPKADERYVGQDSVTAVVQIKGKVRAKLEVSPDIDPKELEKMALEAVADRLGGKEPRKVIVKAPKIVSIVPAE